MTIKYVESAPNEITYCDNDTLKKISQIAEVFQTPLRGSYTWDYQSHNEKIRRLYKIGKLLNWNAETDLDWKKTFPKTEFPAPLALNPFSEYEEFIIMSHEEQLRFTWHQTSWTLSQFLHGEQGALLVASQLISCAPTNDAKLYAGSQTFDEARHVEAFHRYLTEKIGYIYPVTPPLKMLLDLVLADPRWDLKFIGMQIIIEGLALAAFHTIRDTACDSLLIDLLNYVIRDEARHVAFGVTFLEDFVKALSDSEKEDRAQFAYSACVIMKNRMVPRRVFEEFRWNKEKAEKVSLESFLMQQYRTILFSRIIPNLKKIGLLTDKVRPLFDELGVLQFEHENHDGDINWNVLENTPVQ